jgi:uncharacterized protein (TIGR02266 family)
VVRIVLRLASTSDWIRVFDSRDGTLFLSSGAVKPSPGMGAAVRIDLVVGEGGPRVIMRGTVISTRSEGNDAGVVVAIGPNERVKINYLNGYVRGGLLNLREKRRLPLRLAVTYGGVDGPQQTHTRDINEEGVFVVSDSPLPEDSEVHLLITFPGREQPLSLSGMVSHTVVPEDEDVPGMGIVFQMDATTRADLAKAVDELEKRFLADELPESTLE